jgi:hypothetical protein
VIRRIFHSFLILLKAQSHEQNYKCSLRNAKLELKIQDWDKERTNFPFQKEIIADFFPF